VKLRGPVDDQGEPLAPFERPIAVWIELRAPVDLFIVKAAAAAELAEHGSILEPGEPGYPGPPDWLAARHWRQHRPRFLAERGQLTQAEAILARSRGQAP
jgi:hypothetical protein